MAAQLREHGLHAQWSAPQTTVRPKAAPGSVSPSCHSVVSQARRYSRSLLDRKFLFIPITNLMLYAVNCGKHDGGQLLRSRLEMAQQYLACA